MTPGLRSRQLGRWAVFASSSSAITIFIMNFLSRTAGLSLCARRNPMNWQRASATFVLNRGENLKRKSNWTNHLSSPCTLAAPLHTGGANPPVLLMLRQKNMNASRPDRRRKNGSKSFGQRYLLLTGLSFFENSRKNDTRAAQEDVSFAMISCSGPGAGFRRGRPATTGRLRLAVAFEIEREGSVQYQCQAVPERELVRKN